MKSEGGEYYHYTQIRLNWKACSGLRKSSLSLIFSPKGSCSVTHYMFSDGICLRSCSQACLHSFCGSHSLKHYLPGTNLYVYSFVQEFLAIKAIVKFFQTSWNMLQILSPLLDSNPPLLPPPPLWLMKNFTVYKRKGSRRWQSFSAQVTNHQGEQIAALNIYVTEQRSQGIILPPCFRNLKNHQLSE